MVLISFDNFIEQVNVNACWELLIVNTQEFVWKEGYTIM